MATQTKTPKFKPFYWAAVFDNDVINTILKEFSQQLELFSEKKNEYHMTYKFFAKPDDDTTWQSAEGTKQKFLVTGFGYTDGICGLFIDNNSVKIECQNEYPHISVAKNGKNKWVETGQIPKLDTYKFIPLQNPIEVEGIVKKC